MVPGMEVTVFERSQRVLAKVEVSWAEVAVTVPTPLLRFAICRRFIREVTD